MNPSMVSFSALSQPSFRTFKLRPRNDNCIICSGVQSLLEDADYVQFCGGDRPNWEMRGQQPGEPRNRVTAKGGVSVAQWTTCLQKNPQEFNLILPSAKPKRLIDVRPEVEFGICHVPGFTSAWALIQKAGFDDQKMSDIPLNVLVTNPKEFLPSDPNVNIYIVCRLGNDSQIAAEALRSIDKREVIQDIIGGLKAWARDVDDNFPIY